MKEREYLLELYEIYKELLTDKKKEYFKDYYFEDLSLNEIANNNEVSKSYVSKVINSIEKELITYESKLKINNKSKKLKELIKELPSDIKNKIEELL